MGEGGEEAEEASKPPGYTLDIDSYHAGGRKTKIRKDLEAIRIVKRRQNQQARRQSKNLKPCAIRGLGCRPAGPFLCPQVMS